MINGQKNIWKQYKNISADSCTTSSWQTTACTAFCCHQCTNFAWLSYTYVEACGTHALLGSVVRLNSCTVIQSVYTCTAFVITSAHSLLGSVILMLRHVEYTICLDQLYGCTVILLSRLCKPLRNFVVTSAHTFLGPVIVLYRLSEPL